MITDKGLVYGICDADRLDFLQRGTKGYGKGWILRPNLTGRGMRLHETSQEGASRTVREAIDKEIRGEAKRTEDERKDTLE